MARTNLSRPAGANARINIYLDGPASEAYWLAVGEVTRKTRRNMTHQEMVVLAIGALCRELGVAEVANAEGGAQ